MTNHPSPEQIMALKDGALPSEDLTWVVTHTDGCPRCQAILEEERTLDSILAQGLALSTLPDALPSLIAARAIENAGRRTSPLKRITPIFIASAAFGVMVLATILLLTPVMTAGMDTLLIALGGAMKGSIMLLREIGPLFKAVATLIWHAWLPLMIGLSMAALLPLALASRTLTQGPRLRSAA